MLMLTLSNEKFYSFSVQAKHKKITKCLSYNSKLWKKSLSYLFIQFHNKTPNKIHMTSVFHTMELYDMLFSLSLIVWQALFSRNFLVFCFVSVLHRNTKIKNFWSQSVNRWYSLEFRYNYVLLKITTYC